MARTIIYNPKQLVFISEILQPPRIERIYFKRQAKILEEYSLIIEGEEISSIIPTSEVEITKEDNVIDCTGKAVVPALIDAHTHMVFAGSRVEEFFLRLKGVSYQEIHAKGGGILSTVKAVRKASKEELKTLTQKWLKRALHLGIYVVEIKSGYGLSLEDEVKLLEVINELDTPQKIVPTFLGAHAIPPEYSRKEYIKLIKHYVLPLVAHRKLAIFVDAFCEEGAFTPEEVYDIFEHANTLGLKLKLHANQFTSKGCLELLTKLPITSVDHLEIMTDNDLELLKRTNGKTVAVILPSTSFILGEYSYAPVKKLIEAEIPVALATDFNPGTSPTLNLPMLMGFVAIKLKIPPAEILPMVTYNAAEALGINNEYGNLYPGYKANILCLDTPDYREMIYYWGVNIIHKALIKGQVYPPNA